MLTLAHAGQAGKAPEDRSTPRRFAFALAVQPRASVLDCGGLPPLCLDASGHTVPISTETAIVSVLTGITQAQTNISANITYHIKIAIADYGDDKLDTAVFIKAQIPCPQANKLT